jgi:iron complex outermembrane receptor protein
VPHPVEPPLLASSGALLLHHFLHPVQRRPLLPVFMFSSFLPRAPRLIALSTLVTTLSSPVSASPEVDTAAPGDATRPGGALPAEPSAPAAPAPTPSAEPPAPTAEPPAAAEAPAAAEPAPAAGPPAAAESSAPLAAAEPPAAASSVVPAPAADKGESLSAVVVTARYREEDAQKVPIAITTLSEDQLQALSGTFTLKQLANQLPSLNIQGFSGRNQTITVRGLGTNAGGTNDGLEQGVGLYVDGVYRPRTGSVITDLMDVESIQLLRGPQGTLFGKNTVAGAVDIRTIEPGFERIVKAELSYGNYRYVRGYVSLTEPLTDNLTFRVSYLRTRRDGWIYNTTFQDEWDNLDNEALRGDIVFAPSARFKNRLIVDYSIQRGNVGFQLVKEVLPTTLANGTQVRGFYQRASEVGYTPIPIDPFARRTDIDSSQADTMPTWGIQNRADFKPGLGLTLTSISAYRNWKWLPHFDGDQFGANISPLSIVETHQQQFSQELRLASPGAQLLDYTAGLYYFWQEADDDQYTSYGTDASGWIVSPTSPPEVLNGLTAYSHVVPATSSYAAYGQATLNVTDELHLTAGLRFTYEHKTGSYDAFPIGTALPIEALPADIQEAATNSRNGVAPTGSYSDSLDISRLSWTFNAAYDVSDDVHAFATYSRGHKSPGINLVRRSLGVDVFVQPETVDDFELGLKSLLLGGRAELNANLFYAIDRGYQANYVNTAVTPIASYITNVGTLISKGIELDARLFPLRGLMASLAVTLDDARYDSYENAQAQYLTSYLVTQDLSGRRASGAPLWSAGAALEYSAPLSGSLSAYVGGDYSYRSRYRAAVNLDPFSEVPGYHLFAAHAGIGRDDQGWDLSLWVRNALDAEYFNTVSVNAANGITLASIGDPRTFGLTSRLKF